MKKGANATPHTEADLANLKAAMGHKRYELDETGKVRVIHSNEIVQYVCIYFKKLFLIDK